MKRFYVGCLPTSCLDLDAHVCTVGFEGCHAVVLVGVGFRAVGRASFGLRPLAGGCARVPGSPGRSWLRSQLSCWLCLRRLALLRLCLGPCFGWLAACLCLVLVPFGVGCSGSRRGTGVPWRWPLLRPPACLAWSRPLLGCAASCCWLLLRWSASFAVPWAFWLACLFVSCGCGLVPFPFALVRLAHWSWSSVFECVGRRPRLGTQSSKG